MLISLTTILFLFT